MKQRLKQFIENVCATHPRLASIYYATFSQAMSHEQFTVLNGKKKYGEYPCKTMLRRNTHRIEKGLIMEPRKPVFAADYIEETVVSLQQVVNREKRISESTAWSINVLGQYFKVQAPDTRVDRAKAKFKQLNVKIEEGKTPFKRSISRPVDFESFHQLNLTRRSVRWYKDIPVPRELVDKAIDVARQAPSACNRQPFHLKIFDKKEDVIRVGGLPGGTKGFCHNFPMIIAVTGQLRNYYSEADRHIIFIDGSLFAMNFSLALETLELSSCIINWPENLALEKKAIGELDLDPDERILFLISVGYPDLDKKVPYSQKKSLEELRTYY